MSDMVERVARIIDPSSWRVMDSEKASMLRKYRGQNVGWPSDQFQHKESMAKAQEIIAAMQADAAPVAWMYERGSETIILQEPLHRDGVLRGATGWAETPLYAHPPVADRVSTASPVVAHETPETSGKLRDAVDVWRDAYDAYTDFYCHTTEKDPAAVIEAYAKEREAALVADILAMVDGSIAFDCNAADEARKAGIDASAIQGGAASLGRLRRAIKAKWGVK